MSKQIVLIGDMSEQTMLQIQAMSSILAEAANTPLVASSSVVRIAERWVEFNASEDATVLPDALKIDSDVEDVLGIRLDSLNPLQLVLRGSIGINISSKEVIKRGFLAKGLFSSEHVEPNARHYKIGFPIKAGSLDLSVSYQDEANAAAPFGAGYKVRVIMLCRLKQQY